VGTLPTLFRVGLISILVVAMVLFVIGVVFSLTFGLMSLILFKVAPIVLVGWIVMKIFDRLKSRDHLSKEDRT
jgi:archaellum biogenesis protein FlaJ (TadC family)